MAITLKIEGRANGGYKLTYQNVEYEVRNLRYIGYPGAVTVWADELWGNKKILIFPAINVPVDEIQVGETSNYATSQAVCTALDTLIAQITELSSAIGSKADESATSDTGSFSIVAFFKRQLQRITTLITTLTDGTQKTQVVDQNGHPLRSPDHVDCTSTVNVVYRGFNIGQGNTLSINKVDLTDTTNITRTWGTGTWADRASIAYS